MWSRRRSTSLVVATSRSLRALLVKRSTMSQPLTIRVTERRRTVLTPEQVSAVVPRADFWTLADAGYVSYRRSGSSRHELLAHKYVGRVTFGDLTIVVEEKRSGTLGSLVA